MDSTKILDIVAICVHGVGFITFLVLLKPTLTIWKDSIKWLNALSIYAILATHLLGILDSIRTWLGG